VATCSQRGLSPNLIELPKEGEPQHVANKSIQENVLMGESMNSNLLVPVSVVSEHPWNIGVGYLKHSAWAERQFRNSVTRRRVDSLVMEGTAGDDLKCLVAALMREAC
jgi:hypothetical protein